MPVNDGSGSNVTTPVVEFRVYVPSFGTTSEVLSQLFGVCSGSSPHSFRVAFTAGVSELNESLDSGLIS